MLWKKQINKKNRYSARKKNEMLRHKILNFKSSIHNYKLFGQYIGTANCESISLSCKYKKKIQCFLIF